MRTLDYVTHEIQRQKDLIKQLLKREKELGLQREVLTTEDIAITKEIDGALRYILNNSTILQETKWILDQSDDESTIILEAKKALREWPHLNTLLRNQSFSARIQLLPVVETRSSFTLTLHVDFDDSDVRLLFENIEDEDVSKIIQQRKLSIDMSRYKNERERLARKLRNLDKLILITSKRKENPPKKEGA